MNDLERELAIERARVKMVNAKSSFARRKWLEHMTRLIKERSAAQVERMEVERGLR